jgi:hypothetical protein
MVHYSGGRKVVTIEIGAELLGAFTRSVENPMFMLA